MWLVALQAHFQGCALLFFDGKLMAVPQIV